MNKAYCMPNNIKIPLYSKKSFKLKILIKPVNPYFPKNDYDWDWRYKDNSINYFDEVADILKVLFDKT